ncbi:MAG TPA: tryptophan synthase subunit beta, partial [Thermoanaerobaculia bacterium]|nr:tryptophan synthase subunit beta [Thermoanaerobaculia bacterium]
MARTRTVPDAAGRFGPYGGRFVPETLMAPVEELARAYDKARRDRSFRKRLGELLDGRHQGLGHEAAAVGAEAAGGVG